MQRGVELVGYASFVGVVRVVVFTLGVVAGAVALVDWAVRTRRLNPFGPIARTFRRFVEPLMLPVERRVVRAGGQPASAPWWTLVFVVVGGLLFLGALNVVGGLIVQAMYGMQSGASAALVLVSWTFGLLRLALLVRVLSSWFQISPWSRWIRWSYVLTDWMLAPIRRLLPNFGPLDLSPLVAYFLLGILQSILGIP